MDVTGIQKPKMNYDALTLTRQDIQRIDSKVIHVVFGYIRNAESLLDRKCIPMEISLICSSYYYFDDNEYFANASSDYRIVNSENELSVEQLVDENPGSAFGNVLIASQFGGVYVWKFKIWQVSNSSLILMSIGISTQYEDIEKNLDANDEGNNYCLDDTGFFHKNGKRVLETYATYGFEKDDVVTMKLDINGKTLKFKCDRAEEVGWEGFGDIVCGLDIYYKMAVCCCKTNDKIQLIDFCFKE